MLGLPLGALRGPRPFSPGGNLIDIAVAVDNSVTVVNTATLQVIARIPVGQVPKRNGTALLRP